jgi:hypothetical protein
MLSSLSEEAENDAVRSVANKVFCTSDGRIFLSFSANTSGLTANKRLFRNTADSLTVTVYKSIKISYPSYLTCKSTFRREGLLSNVQISRLRGLWLVLIS